MSSWVVFDCILAIFIMEEFAASFFREVLKKLWCPSEDNSPRKNEGKSSWFSPIIEPRTFQTWQNNVNLPSAILIVSVTIGILNTPLH
jgi:antibiotic biosynthesis monooxygenase (ABM) superfamily enzyme